ncbi:general substrate transporter [Microdochium trichocladiopsis]|uniref:General substrate transporter n=1 Tax=Microdochium trichocladiopsis TaxID=1682393 RepID=A0A9P8XXQ6_9PEZI|nr:general substrate transporter [Microdochium trichocladiopsis]KAH7021332.1 general substrate transporter [Microdochium trichocladiopsis]
MATTTTDLGKAEADMAKPQPSHAEHAGYTANMELIEAAVAASDAEALIPKKELFSRYWPAVTFSMLLSLALVMEGMDTGLINNFFGQDAYLNKFGWVNPATGKKYISADWQSAIGAGNNCGSIIGLLLNGWLQSRFGSRRVYMAAMALMGCTIFVLFFSTSVTMLLIGNIMCGVPWGIFQTLTTAYAAEICPAAMRGYLTAWVSMCWGAGTFLATGVLRGSLNLEGDAAWRVPYGLQWIWIPPLILVGYLSPESPWFLVRKGRIADAEKSLRRLARKDYYTERSMAETLALMQHTNEMERIEAANSNYRDCFRGTNTRRTIVTCMAWIIQMLNGQSITAFAVVLLRSVGMDQVAAFNYNMGIQSVNIIATGIAIMLMGRVSRRAFYLFGTSGIGFMMLIIGIVGFFVNQNKTMPIVVAAMLVIVQIIFKISLGPTTYVIVGEIASNRVRAQTIVLGRAVYVCGQLIVQQLNPRMLNSDPTAWNWGARTGLFYFGFCVIWTVWIYFCLPETRNRSFADIDYLFQKKVSARKFTTTPIDLFEIVPATEGKTIDDDAEPTTTLAERVEEKRA